MLQKDTSKELTQLKVSGCRNWPTGQSELYVMHWNKWIIYEELMSFEVNFEVNLALPSFYHKGFNNIVFINYSLIHEMKCAKNVIHAGIHFSLCKVYRVPMN